MKCRNCGYSFHGVTCPLCGKKNIGAKRCSVCGEVVYPGNSRCVHCGNPVCNDAHTTTTSSSITTDKHTSKSHTYTFEEGYDYKKNAYSYKESIKKQYKKHSINLQGPLIQALIIIVVSTIIIVAVGLSYRDNTKDFNISKEVVENIDEGNTNLESLTITGYISPLQNQCNYANTQVVTMQGEDIYFNDIDLYKTNRNFILNDKVENIAVDSNFYIDGDLIYYVDWISGVCVRKNGVQTILDENGRNLQKIGKKLYYQDENNKLYCYDIDEQKSRIVSKDIHYFYIDESIETIYFIDTDYYIKKMKLDGTGVIDLGVEALSFIVDGSMLYLKQWGDNAEYYLKAYDMEQKAYTLEYGEDNIVDIARYEDSFIFSDDTGKLYRKFDNREELELLFDGNKEIYSFQLIGDKVVIGVFDNNYNLYWYLLDYEGQYARIIAG